MKVCESCQHDRILVVNAKCSDMCDVHYNEKDHVGYVPSGLNIGNGDYIEFEVCLDCGKIQGDFPVTEEVVIEALIK
jgi:hypothetical protein